jgi:hypothetical protein
VAGRAGEGRHQLRKDYKKKERERETELGGRIEGGNRHKKKKEADRCRRDFFFIQMGKRTVGNLTKSTKRFLFVFSFVSFVLLLFWSWPFFFFFFSLDDFKTRKRRESDKWKRHLISFDSTTTRRK